MISPMIDTLILPHLFYHWLVGLRKRKFQVPDGHSNPTCSSSSPQRQFLVIALFLKAHLLQDGYRYSMG